MKKMTWTLIALAAMIVAFALLLNSEFRKKDDLRNTTIHEAVLDRDIAAVERLIRSGATLEGRDEVGATPLISACSSGQFRIAELLIDAGADVFAVDDFGVTAGRMAQQSRIRESSSEGRARARVLERMEEKGFPFPAPNSDEVSALKEAGAWPPK